MSTNQNSGSDLEKSTNSVDVDKTDAADENIIDWEENDAANPHNWPSGKKWRHIVLVLLLALVT